MKAFKEVDVVVTSIIEPVDKNGFLIEGESSEKTVIKKEGFLKNEDGVLFLNYFEETDGIKVYTDIEIRDGIICVERKGGIESRFVFDENTPHKSVYKIPPYSFDAEIVTKKTRRELSFENGGELSIFYTMTVGGDIRRAKMRIEVYPERK